MYFAEFAEYTFFMFAQHERILTGASPQAALTVGRLQLHERSVVNAVRSQIADVLRDKPINHRLMTDCVNTIRRYPDSIPEWHRSATAELYTPKVFKNKKKSGGYWW